MSAVAYLDTHVAIWLAQGEHARVPERARSVIRASRLLVSPMVQIELEYQYEIRRIVVPSRDVLIKLQAELGVCVCTLPFETIAVIAAQEKWTRDPFDRIIVANAKANGLSPLISSDSHIQSNYAKAAWA